MLSFPHARKIYLAVAPVDMRKQFNGLWAAAEQTLQAALAIRNLRHAQEMQILYWDGTGVWILAKRLERGRVSWPVGSDAVKLSLGSTALAMLLDGIELKHGCTKAWYERLPE